MKDLKRMAIIGNAGSGKSTLAKALQEIFKIPIYHLDQYFWKPNWTRPNPNEYKVIHDKICDQEKWIIDGMNLRFLEYRIERADIIIFLNISRHICLYRIFKRTIKYYGKETPSGAPQCTERFNWEFLKFLKWVWDFKSKYNPKIFELFNKYDCKEIYILKSKKDIDTLFEKLKIRY